jgi:hypothetical protein
LPCGIPFAGFTEGDIPPGHSVFHWDAAELKKVKNVSKIIAGCLEKGIDQGGFHTVPVDATVNLSSAAPNGMIRPQNLKLFKGQGIKETAVEFCR